jgi:thiol-disulfide isomerase/thioredoxin
MKRRSVLFASAAVVAGSAGVGAALWHSSRDRSAASNEPHESDIWSMGFDMPKGGRLELASLRGKPLLLNFWATWCPPCVSELPLLDRFHREQSSRGWSVAGLAVDNRDPVLDFLAKRPVGFAIGLAGMEGVGLSRSLGNTTGALPFTVVFDSNGHALHRKLGVIAPEDLTSWVASIA